MIGLHLVLLEVDPNSVKPGWTPLIITILLAAAIVGLMISMRRQIRKVNLPHRDDALGPGPVGEPEQGSADGEPEQGTADGEPEPPAAEQQDAEHRVGNSNS